MQNRNSIKVISILIVYYISMKFKNRNFLNDNSIFYLTYLNIT